MQFIEFFILFLIDRLFLTVTVVELGKELTQL